MIKHFNLNYVITKSLNILTKSLPKDVFYEARENTMVQNFWFTRSFTFRYSKAITINS